MLERLKPLAANPLRCHALGLALMVTGVAATCGLAYALTDGVGLRQLLLVPVFAGLGYLAGCLLCELTLGGIARRAKKRDASPSPAHEPPDTTYQHRPTQLGGVATGETLEAASRQAKRIATVLSWAQVTLQLIALQRGDDLQAADARLVEIWQHVRGNRPFSAPVDDSDLHQLTEAIVREASDRLGLMPLPSTDRL